MLAAPLFAFETQRTVSSVLGHTTCGPRGGRSGRVTALAPHHPHEYRNISASVIVGKHLSPDSYLPGSFSSRTGKRWAVPEGGGPPPGPVIVRVRLPPTLGRRNVPPCGRCPGPVRPVPADRTLLRRSPRRRRRRPLRPARRWRCPGRHRSAISIPG